MPAENRTEASELSEEVRTAARSLLSSAASGDVDAFREAASKLPEGQAPGFREPAHQRNALHIAALSGHANVVAAAVDEFRFPQDEPDQQGRTALSLAAATAQKDVVSALVARECALDTCSEIGATPLNYAAASGCVDTLQLLLAAGASVDASNSKTGSPLLWAISTGRLESVKALLDAGASPNAVNSGGASALAMAAAGSKLEILHALLESGASPSYASSKGGITALHAAANAGSVDSISALLEAGADTEARDDKGHKPLHEAAVSGHQKAVELLIGRTAPDPGVPGTEWTVDNILKAAQEANRKAKEEQAQTPSIQVPEPEDPNPDLAVAVKSAGDQAFRAKEYAAALEHYTTSLRHDTSRHVVWANRSAALLALGRAEEAMRDAQVSRSIDKTYAKGWYREGKAAQALGRWEDAACAFFEGHCVAPDNKDLEVSFKYAVQEGKKAHKAKPEGS